MVHGRQRVRPTQGCVGLLELKTTKEGAFDMLVLSRHRDETIMIGDDIEITIVDIKGDKVRIGINAPRDIQVHRKEVYEAIKRENTDAAQVQIDDLSGANKSARPLHRPRPSARVNGTHKL
jgi:carbon storage regulator